MVAGCAASGQEMNRAEETSRSWWSQQERCRALDKQHLNALYNLERLPDDSFLRDEQARIKSESEQCRQKLQQAEQEKREAQLQWEMSIVQQQLELKSIREAEQEANERDRKHGRMPR